MMEAVKTEIRGWRNNKLYSLLHVFDEDFSLPLVSSDRFVEVSQQVGRHHDINRSVQAPGICPEVQLLTQANKKMNILVYNKVSAERRKTHRSGEAV
jgi:hypothetical protein